MVLSFTVNPSTGGGPYVIKGKISPSNSLGKKGDNKDFYLEVQTATDTGACPATGAGTYSSLRDAILKGQDYNETTPVSTGDCRLYVASIHKASDDSIVSSKKVTIDNV